MDGYNRTSYGPSNGGTELEPFPAEWSCEPGQGPPLVVSRPDQYPESYVFMKTEAYIEQIQPPVVNPRVCHVANEQMQRPMSPAHNRRAFDRPTHDSPTYYRPAHDSPTLSRLAHDRPAFDRPAHGQPTHDRPSHDSPAHDSPTRSRLAHDPLAHSHPAHAPLAHDRPSQDRHAHVHDRTTYDRPAHHRQPEVEQFIDRIQTEASRPTVFSTTSPQERTWRQEPHLASQTGMNRPSRFTIPLSGPQNEPNRRSHQVSQPTQFQAPPRTESWSNDSQPTRIHMPSQTESWHQNSYNPNHASHAVRHPGRSQPGGFHVPPQTEPWQQQGPFLGRNNSWPRKGTNGAIDTHVAAPGPNYRPSFSHTKSYGRPTDSRLSKPTNSIESALEYLKGDTRASNGNSTPPKPGSPKPIDVSAVPSPKWSFRSEMDSKEAEELYGPKAYPMPAMANETYHGATIDSMQAAQLYRGALV